MNESDLERAVKNVRTCFSDCLSWQVDDMVQAVKIAYGAYELNKDKKLTKNEKPHGYTILVGGNKKDKNKHTSLLAGSLNIFKEQPCWIYDDNAAKIISDASSIDGVFWVDKDMITDIGLMLLNINPKYVAKKMKLPDTGSLSSDYGFFNPVGTRNITAIVASYVFNRGKKKNNSPVLVIAKSEENGNMRIFYNGKILFSTNQEEEQEVTFKQPVSFSQYIKNVGSNITSASNAFVKNAESASQCYTETPYNSTSGPLFNPQR